MKKALLIVLMLSILITACSTEEYDPFDELTTDELEENQDINDSENVEEEFDEELYEEGGPLDELTYEEDQQMKDSLKYPIQLSLEKTDSSVKLTWTVYEGDHEFASYKVSRSVTDANPTYPGQSLRKTITDINETSYEDVLPEEGISYYVISAISPLNEKTHSNPVKVEFPNLKETPDQEISLTVVKTEDGVQLNWDKYNGDFLFYKVVWTTDHPFPKYPDDSAKATIAYVNQTEYLHLTPDPGVNYYAVTIVRPDKSRFTSSRAEIIIE
ncbi:hypothetical protein HN789_03430 [archaeon]|nr:hypothetical protein [archaeon]MBT4022652.1 hypothetical protein [archaeon]MBT4272092.1 hypothetical protein [archaeon]MBT4461189.1 hypothetical protein [archaeon]MBT4858804.1 hypothetical protein [archaeon]